MNVILLSVLLILFISCGKTTSDETQVQSVEPIQTTSSEGIDLLEALIDVPIKIQDSEITFLANRSASSNGRRSSCKTEVKNGEMYEFSLIGNKLHIMATYGTYEMSRMGEGESIIGSWIWKGNVGDVYTIRQITFLSESRMILKINCEF